MLKKCSLIIAGAAVATVLVSGTAISQMVDIKPFPADRTHATQEMIDANPDRF